MSSLSVLRKPKVTVIKLPQGKGQFGGRAGRFGRTKFLFGGLCPLLPTPLVAALEIYFIEKLLEEIRRWPKPCFTIPIIRENRFSPFDFVPLATLRFGISQHHKRMTMQNFLQSYERDVWIIEHSEVYIL